MKENQIPDSKFLVLKARHKEKVWISIELEKDTGETVKEIRTRFHNQHRDAQRF